MRLSNISNNIKNFLLTNLLTIVFFMVLGYVVYLWFVPVKVYDRTVERFEVLTPEVRPGGVVKYVVEFCKVKKSKAQIDVNLVNGSIVGLKSYDSNLDPDCYRFVQQAHIPEGEAPGRYIIEITAQNQVNLLRIQTEKFTTEPFEVVPEDQADIEGQKPTPEPTIYDINAVLKS